MFYGILMGLHYDVYVMDYNPLLGDYIQKTLNKLFSFVPVSYLSDQKCFKCSYLTSDQSQCSRCQRASANMWISSNSFPCLGSVGTQQSCHIQHQCTACLYQALSTCEMCIPYLPITLTLIGHKMVGDQRSENVSQFQC